MLRRVARAARTRLWELGSALGRDLLSRAETGRGFLWPPRPRQAAFVFAAGVAGLGIYGLLFQLTLPGRLPSALDWRSLSALVERDAKPGDAVMLEPWWAERSRQVLPTSLPVMTLPGLAGEDLIGVKRVWLVSLPDAPGRTYDVQNALFERARSATDAQRLGGLSVTRFDLRTPVLPLAFLPDRLATATVAAGRDPCPADDQGVFHCPNAQFVTVARQVREVNFRPRPCIAAYPSPDPDAPLTLTFADVQLGRELRGHTGIIGESAYDGRSTVRMVVKIDGEERGVADEPPRQPGWHTFHIDTTQENGRIATVTFRITAPDVTRRDFCFDAYTLP